MKTETHKITSIQYGFKNSAQKDAADLHAMCTEDVNADSVKTVLHILCCTTDFNLCFRTELG